MPVRPVRILFLDDDTLVLNALRRTLRKEPFELHFTESPDIAFELVASHSIDVVVSDYSMPTMSGAIFFAELARRHPHVRRVLMTGQSDKAVTASAQVMGQVEVILEKPWNNQELIQALRAFDQRP